MASDVGVPSKANVTAPAASPVKEAKVAAKPVAAPAEPVAAAIKPSPAPLSQSAAVNAAPTPPKKAVAKASPSKVAPAKVAPKAEISVKVKADAETSPVPPVDAIRGVAEQSLAQARTAFAKSQAATHQFAQGFEASGEVVQSGMKELQLRVSEAIEAQTHAAFNYFRAVTKAHTLSELIDLQSTELRRGVERTLSEAKEVSSLAQAIATKATEPVRKAIDHAVETTRQAR
jgi:hypothetical protein